MFSFHKPKVYRSSTGCCICKAKSSSSRFTDSKKYEEDFLKCFQLIAPRQGEICNACVLLVKRWKKLPAGSDRNWRHVVDARAGPGMKSMTKFKSKKKLLDSTEKIDKIMKKKKRKLEREGSPALSDQSDHNKEDQDVEMNEDFLQEGNGSGHSSRVGSPVGSDCEDNAVSVSRRRKAQAKRLESTQEISAFVDLSFWKPELVCCGTIYKGANGEMLIDPRFLKPCKARLAKTCKISPESPTTDEKSSISDSQSSKSYSDSSSDSGYDESSNPGAEKDSNNHNSTNPTSSSSASSIYKQKDDITTTTTTTTTSSMSSKSYLEKCEISISPIAVGGN